MVDESIYNEKKDKILDLIKDKSYIPMKTKELMIFLKVPNNSKSDFEKIINRLAEEGSIYITRKGNISTPEYSNVIVGTFLGTARSFGFVSPDDESKKEIFIPPDGVNGAMHKDKVFCRIVTSGFANKKDEGAIVKIIKRANNQIVGTFVVKRHENYIVPDNKKISEYIRISNKDTMGAVAEHKVVVTLLKKKDKDERTYGKVIEILGHKNDPGVDILSIISEFEIPTEFPNEVSKQLEAIPYEVLKKELIGRRDLREEKIITIDGEDTKDVDDAISINKLDNGNFSLGVHIADVSHYVTEYSPIDREALRRGTSVYLVDRVIPMLPYKLSNGICSLNEGVDRLTLSCVMEIDKRGIVVSHEIFTGVINVTKKTNYTIVQDLLENENSEHIEEYKEYLDMFKSMEELSFILREKRVQRGAIEFDFPESKIILDDEGKPIEIISYERSTATGIIEEFMLACNETIAEEYFWMEMPFVYRTHEEPSEEKIETLVEFIKRFGYTLKGTSQHPKDIQKLLSKVESTPEENIISRIVLRSLKQARYTYENLGHFGLAAQYYSHFTSPIRRYPDLQIHRIIKENITKGLIGKRVDHYNNILPAVCVQCSKMERIAEQAEREVENLKKVEYMEDRIGEVFEGIISSVVAWGFYVILPNTIEGLVRADSLIDDKYVFEERLMEYVGQKSKKSYMLGDKVKVKVIKTNIEERNIDFEIFDETEEEDD